MANTQEEFFFKELNTLNDKVASTKGLPEELNGKLTQMLQRLNRMAQLGHYAEEFGKVKPRISWI